MITLIIVDCQNDFISGTMAVKGAKNVIESIKDFIKSHRKEMEKILFTVDWHIYNHPSFKRCGGMWPQHCVQYTPGACIESKLLKYVQASGVPYEVDEKAQFVEQYGAFEDIEYVPDSGLIDKYYFDSIVSANADTTFVVCGIAGDYCVKATVENMIKENITPKVFLSGITSIDDGKTIKEFIKENKLEVL